MCVMSLQMSTMSRPFGYSGVFSFILNATIPTCPKMVQRHKAGTSQSWRLHNRLTKLVEEFSIPWARNKAWIRKPPADPTCGSTASLHPAPKPFPATSFPPGSLFICTSCPCESSTSSVYVRTSLGCSSEEPHSLKRACRDTVHGTGWKNGAQSLLLGLDVRRTWCLNSAQSLIVHILYEYSYGNLQELRSSFEMLCIIENAGSLGSFLFFLCQLRREKRDRSGNSVI